MDIGDLEKLRPCGRLETYSTARHHLGYYNNVALTATYNSSSQSSDALKDSIYAALKHVIAKHPVLGAVPVDEGKSYPDTFFVRLPFIDLSRSVEIRDRRSKIPSVGEVDAELNQLLAEQHARNFKDDTGTNPFWRLVVLTSSTGKDTFTATWTFHHALSDGASAFIFHETFLDGLNNMEAVPNADSIVETPTSPLLPAFEDLHPMTISWPFFLTTISKALLPSIFDRRLEKLWTGNPVPTKIPSPPQCHFRTLILPANTTKLLAEASRKENVSVTCTLECLIAASLFTHLPPSQFDKIKFSNPMSMRRFLKDVPDDQMLVAVNQYHFTHHRTSSPHESRVLQNFSWAEARAVKSTIEAELAKAGADNPIALFKYVSNMHDFVNGHLGKPRGSSVELSNIGVYRNRDEGGRWTIGRVTFSQCPNPTAEPLCVSVVTGGDGCANLNFCWFEGAVEEGLVGEVMEGVRQGVEALVGERQL
ncbi:hypothetical protein HBI46_188240 [Parastagonospora nodorum]|nr:hypothetical protein HBI46_188240 [Parastagonospora nodorum]